MPKAAMHQHNHFVLRQHDVRPARKATDMKPKPVPKSMEHLPNQDLGLCVGALDPGHYRASASHRNHVRHRRTPLKSGMRTGGMVAVK